MFDSAQEATEQLVRRDMIDVEIRRLKPKGLLSRDECVVTHCQEKEKNALLQAKMRETEKEFLRMKKEIESLQESMERELSHEEKENLLIRSMQSREVQVQHKMVIELKERNEQLEKAYVEMQKQFEGYKKDQDRIMTNFEADKKIQEKVNLIRSLRDKRDLLLVQNEDLEVKADTARVKYEKLAEAYNDLVMEYKTIWKKIESLKLVEKHGFKLVPMEELSLNNDTPLQQPEQPKKKRWSLFRKKTNQN